MKKKAWHPRPFVAMTVAGSDSGGGAGIQADLKTFQALGVYGTSSLTAITAQNTLEVREVTEVPAEMVAAQMDAVVEDIGVDALKTGMLSSSVVIDTVSAKIRENGLENLVVDPVMVAKSGHRLLKEEAVLSLMRHLIPLARVVTPNLPEAARLVGLPVEDLESMRRAARALVDMGAEAAVVKGGHGQGEESVDVLFTRRRFRELRAPRVSTSNTHGTGCTFSAAITAHLARGLAVEESVELAKLYLTEALRRGVAIGKGHGPVEHFVGCRRWRPRSPR